MFVDNFKIHEDEKLAKRVLKRAIEAHKDPRNKEAKTLVRVLNRHIQIDGFTKIQKAPSNKVLRALVPYSDIDPLIWEITLAAWFNANSGLSNAVFDFLKEKDFNPPVPFDFDSEEDENSFSLLIADFTSLNSSFEPAETRLMFRYALYLREIAPQCFEEEESSQSSGFEDLPDFWKGCLEKLSEFPLDSPEWGAVGSFNSEVERVKGRKEAEIKRDSYLQPIRELLGQISAGFGSTLSFLGMEELLSWQEADLHNDIIARVVADLQTLKEKLASYKGLEEESKNREKTVAEERLKRQKIESLEREIETLYSGLLELFRMQAGFSETREINNVPENEASVDEHIGPTEKEVGLEIDISATEAEGSTDPAKDIDAAENSTEDISLWESGVPEAEYECQQEIVETQTDQANTESGQVADAPPVSETGLETDIDPLSIKSAPGTIIDSSPELEPEFSLEIEETEPSYEETSESSQASTPDLEIPVEGKDPRKKSERERSEERKDNGKTAETAEDEVQHKTDDEAEPGAGSPSWNNFLCSLIIDDDLPAAYWISRSSESSLLPCKVPSWLISAVLGSRLLSWDSDHLVGDLLDLASKYLPGSDETEKIMGVAAALKPALIAPGAGMAAWLQEPASLPQIQAILQSIRSFATYGYPIKPQDLSGVETKEDREALLQKIVSETREFLEQAPARTTKFALATNIWRYLVSPGGPLYSILSYVCGNNRDLTAEQFSALVQEWSLDDFVEARIDEQIRKMSVIQREIVSAPKRHLKQNISLATVYARKWLDLTAREDRIQRRGTWFYEQLLGLKATIQEGCENTFPDLVELNRSADVPETAAASAVLGRSLVELADILHIKINSDWRNQFSSGVKKWVLESEQPLQTILNDRLVWVTEESLHDDCSPADLSFKSFAGNLRKACDTGRGLRNAAGLWIEKQDYRFIEKIIDRIRLEEPSEADSVSALFQNNLKLSREALKSEAIKADDAIERAMVDGVLIEEDRARMIEIVSMLEPEKELGCCTKLSMLESEVHQFISLKRKERLAHLSERWSELRSHMKALDLEPPLEKNLESFIEKRLASEDTRIIGECLAHLSDVLEGGKTLDQELFTPKKKGYQDFNNFLANLPELEVQCKRLESVLVSMDRERASTRLANDRFETAKEAVKAFFNLEKNGNNRQNSIPHIRSILQFLGYRSLHGTEIMFETKYSVPDMLFLQAHITAGTLARPIPEFGSLIEGKANILVLWDRPVADTITSFAQQLRLQGVIILFLGMHSLYQRRDILRLSRKSGLTLAILDKSLLLYLTREYGERLGPFLRCSLPYTMTNPYKPFVHGDVPLEMFYGRTRMADELQGYSTCFVYGGRQLGKSALLRQVHNHFMNPALEQYSAYLDIRNIGAPGSRDASRYQEEIWGRIRDELQKIALLNKSIRTSDPKTLSSHIRSKLDEKTGRRLLLLFDEADNFLDADSTEGFFPVVQELRTLMADTHRRFKVVFAGLHNVQRFQGIANQPLAAFGVPLQVGPLDPADAAQLVREPLETIGFELDEAAILRILSYTNYHAGLIQLFCKKLVERMSNSSTHAMQNPPFKIERADVEAVYRDRSVQDEIRQRLEMTLELDKRYQAIAWSMITEQQAERDSYSRAFSPREVLDMVRFYWQRGFDGKETEDIRGILDEMCGLGVLVRNSAGLYRLRSPNVVSLMGSNILDRLAELENKTPEEKFLPDSHHAPISANFEVYSPFTYEEERKLTRLAEYGVSIIFSSPALGLEHVERAVISLAPPDLVNEGTALVKEIPNRIKSGGELKSWLIELQKSSLRTEHIIVFMRPLCSPYTLAELLDSSLEFCDQHHSGRRKWIRIVFILDPTASECWFLIDREARDKLTNKCKSLVSPRLWNESGIRNRLYQIDKLHSKEVCEEILDATGGWPILLDELFKRAKGENNLIIPSREFKSDLLLTGSSLRDIFVNSICLGSMDNVTDVFNLFIKLNTISVSDVHDLHLLILDETKSSKEKQDLSRAVEYLSCFRIVHRVENELCIDRIVRLAFESL